jgi:tetratricopeptide repeat protein
VLPLYEKSSGPQNFNVATILANLAMIYHDRKDYAKAELFFQRSLAIEEKVLGPEHPFVGDILTFLARHYI